MASGTILKALAVLFSIFLPFTQGLICFTCNGEKSFDLCTRMGSLSYCQPNEKSCHTEVLRFKRPEGIVFSISKRCKEDDACKNNEVQNPRAAWAPSQCNPRFPNSVCRCCCKGDLCNRGGLYCPLGPMCRAIPEIKANGYTQCDLGRNRGSICIHECLKGFTLIGPDTTECKPAKQLRWTNTTIPKCVRTECIGGKISIANGKTTCSNGNLLGSQCEFTCKEGYMLQLGWPIISCSRKDQFSDPVWDGTIPVCSKITCDPLPIPKFGTITCSNEENIDSVCKLGCDKKKQFYPVGRKTNKCYIKGGTLPPTWDGEIGTCKKIKCNPIIPPKDGSVKCSDTFFYRSACRFSCDAGYGIQGTKVVKCSTYAKFTGNGKWDKPFPKCVTKKCAALKAPAKGSMNCTNDFKYLSRCSFSCNKGLAIVGALTLSCDTLTKRGKAKWSDRVPKCRVNVCDDITAPVNGTMDCSKEFKHLSECSFKCKEGFAVEGSSLIKCSTDKSGNARWNRPVPKCVVKRCLPVIEAPVNGKRKCSNGNRYGSRCSFQCSPGFALKGEPETVCRKSSLTDATVWSNKVPVCQVDKCDDIVAPVDGTMDCSAGFKHLSECSFKCAEGFNLDGSSVVTCALDEVKNVEWDLPVPKCVVKRCFPAVLPPENGKGDCDNGNRYGSKCSFQCSPGFVMDGEPETVCRKSVLTDATAWSNKVPTCGVDICNTMAAPVNGTMDCSKGFKHLSECSFKCAEGFSLVGSPIITCSLDELNNVDWDLPVPKCVVKRCFPAVVPPENGKGDCDNGNRYGSRCTFECLPGFAMNGEPETTCGKSETSDDTVWSNEVPVCRVDICKDIIAPSNGSMICTKDFNHLSDCSFVCDEGFRLSGSPLVTCVSDELEGVKWNLPVPQCVVKRCFPTIVPPENGNGDCDNGNRYGSTCSFQCLPGFVMNGEPETTCGKSSTGDETVWSNEVPVCEVDKCSDINTPANGSMVCTKEFDYLSECSFKCREGFSLFRDPLLTCVLNDSGIADWDLPVPLCVVKRCFPVIEPPENGKGECDHGNEYGSHCTFECLPGFMMSGEPETKCGKSIEYKMTDWSNKVPVCLVNTCSDISAPADGTMDCTDDFNHLSECSFECNEGYSLTGAPVVKCATGGSGGADWNLPVPECVVKRCYPVLGTPPNGLGGCDNGNRYGSRCSFKCLPGFAMIGEPETTCGKSATSRLTVWSNQLPVCKAVTCPPISNVINRRVSCSKSSRFGSNCKFSCSSGMVLQGAGAVTCQDLDGDGIGEWSEEFPTCALNLCPEIERPENGLIRCTRGRFSGSQCSFICNSGYKRKGNRAITCQSLKKSLPVWNGEPPVCEIINCPAIESPPDGEMSCTADTEFKSQCKFSCRDGYDLYPEVSESIHCQADGNWSSQTPCCFEYCPPSAIMDMIIVLDSSSSIRPRNWVKVISFVKSLIKAFTISPEYSKFGFFRYNKAVDTANEVFLKDYNTLRQLNRALDKMPYNGEGTNTGAALSHALTTSLLPSNGNRPEASDVILLITDGVSTSGDIESAVQRLRNSSVKIVAMFIEPSTMKLTDKAIKQLELITADPEHIIKQSGFDSLSDVLGTVSAVACRRQCHGKELSIKSSVEFSAT